MPYAMVPPGYRAVLLGQAASLDGMGSFAPLEEGAAEGALFLMRLDLAEFPTDTALSQLEQACSETGVEIWPGYDYVVYADTGQPSVYLAWQKGLAWMPIIIGLLVAVVLPPVLTAAVWWILPEDIKSLITGIINVGIMVLVMFLMSKMMPALLPAKEKPEKLEEART